MSGRIRLLALETKQQMERTSTRGPPTLRTHIEQWPLVTPFRVIGYTWESTVLVVNLGKDGEVGRGEAAGAYYKNDTPASMDRQLQVMRRKIEAGISRLLPRGGSRNALDCALPSLLDESRTRSTLEACCSPLGLPAADPTRPGAKLDRLVTACLTPSQ
jgi:hypothetical protein